MTSTPLADYKLNQSAGDYVVTWIFDTANIDATAVVVKVSLNKLPSAGRHQKLIVQQYGSSGPCVTYGGQAYLLTTDGTTLFNLNGQASGSFTDKKYMVYNTSGNSEAVETYKGIRLIPSSEFGPNFSYASQSALSNAITTPCQAIFIATETNRSDSYLLSAPNKLLYDQEWMLIFSSPTGNNVEKHSALPVDANPYAQWFTYAGIKTRATEITSMAGLTKPVYVIKSPIGGYIDKVIQRRVDLISYDTDASMYQVLAQTGPTLSLATSLGLTPITLPDTTSMSGTIDATTAQAARMAISIGVISTIVSLLCTVFTGNVSFSAVIMVVVISLISAAITYLLNRPGQIGNPTNVSAVVADVTPPVFPNGPVTIRTTLITIAITALVTIVIEFMNVQPVF